MSRVCQASPLSCTSLVVICSNRRKINLAGVLLSKLWQEFCWKGAGGLVSLVQDAIFRAGGYQAGDLEKACVSHNHRMCVSQPSITFNRQWIM